MSLFKRGDHWHMDVTISGVRYRESLQTGDWREARAAEKDRVAEIKAGKGASKHGREFARKSFSEASEVYQQEREPHVSERTTQFEMERLKPMRKFFGGKMVMRIKAEDIAGYQQSRLKDGVKGRTINMEVGVLRRILKRAKIWNALSEDVRMFPEHEATVGRVLSAEQKKLLFQVASSKDEWMVTYCAAVLAVSTTCRGVEIKHLQWQHVDLMKQVMTVNRSKTQSGIRTIPLNADAVAALSRLWARAESNNATEPEHYVFPTCEAGTFNPSKPQKSFRTAWRKMTEDAGLKGFRFHDLRHQSITELAEAGASDATLQALAGHLSRRMMEHYSHVRMERKREAIERLSCGLVETAKDDMPQEAPEMVN